MYTFVRIPYNQCHKLISSASSVLLHCQWSCICNILFSIFTTPLTGDIFEEVTIQSETVRMSRYNCLLVFFFLTVLWNFVVTNHLPFVCQVSVYKFICRSIKVFPRERGTEKTMCPSLTAASSAECRVQSSISGW